MSDQNEKLRLHGLPDRDTLMILEPEDIASFILCWINKDYSKVPHRAVCMRNFTLPFQDDRELGVKLSSGWMWLINHGLLVPQPGNDMGWFVPSERGQQVLNHTDLNTFKQSKLLPRELLHPEVLKLVSTDFAKGDYATAVFKVFLEIEVFVRKAAGYDETLYGVTLMSKAFDPQDGPLTDHSNPDKGEKTALRNLFTGAIGSYKNPHSHRKVDLDPTEAAEMILLGNHLYRIAESRYQALEASQAKAVANT